MAVDPRVASLIQKMMAKETSLREIGTDAALLEAGVAAVKIAELCLRHKIELTEVELESAEAEDPIARELYEYDGTEEYRAKTKQAWEIQLASSVARAHDCRVLVGAGYLAFVGRSADRAVATQMFRILRREVTEACTYGYRKARRNSEDTRGYIASFFVSAVSAIARRYRDMKANLVEQAQAQALVLRTDAALDEAIAHLPTNDTKQRGSVNMLGAVEGITFGSTVGLGGSALGGDGRQARSLGDGS